MPMTFAGRAVAAASLVIEMEEVFEDRITFRATNAVKIAKQFGFDFEFFRGRLNNEIATSQFCPAGDCGNSPDGLRLLRLVDPRLGNLAIQVLRNHRRRAVQKFLFQIAQHNFVSVARKHVRDAVTHSAAADDPYSLNGHGSI